MKESSIGFKIMKAYFGYNRNVFWRRVEKAKTKNSAC